MNHLKRELTLIVISILISLVICYLFLIKLVMRMAPLIKGTGIIVFITLSFIVYILLTTILDRKLNKRNIGILMIIYFMMIIVLSFFRNKYSTPQVIINPLVIIKQFKWNFSKTFILSVCNLFIYIPIGAYLRYKLKYSNLKIYLGFLVYIFAVEMIQYISRRGVFDINDIIINTLGFIIGSEILLIVKNNFKAYISLS